MAKTMYTPELAKKFWEHLDTHQDDDFKTIGNQFGLTAEQARKLSVRQAMGDQSGFKKEYEEYLNRIK